MRTSNMLWSVVASCLAQANAQVNLFANGQTGPLLGSFFGTPGANATFDYVIIGGGTAGLAIASRLAENKALTIAVVEPGSFSEIDGGTVSIIPGQTTDFSQSESGLSPSDYQPLIDWGIVTTPQSQLGGRTLHYARGKTLGGSSARNFLVYQRATNGSLQKWADTVGDQAYSPNGFFPYYKKSVDVTDNANEFLGQNITNILEDAGAELPKGGPLKVSFGGYSPPLAGWFYKALQAVGMKAVPGMIDGELIGSSFTYATIDRRNGHRVTSESSYLQQAFQNNLPITVYKSTQARQILFDGQKTATGVKCMTPGTFGSPSVEFVLTAKKEVILSAGAFQSPQLLMVSGIGDRQYLSRFRIPSVQHLPGVGQNMWDHVLFGSVHAVDVTTASEFGLNSTYLGEAFEEYITQGTGPLSIFSSGQLSWEKLPEPYRSNLSNYTRQSLDDPRFISKDWPELEWLPANAFIGNDFDVVNNGDGRQYASLLTALVAPFSRGSVTLKSASMDDLPVVDIAYLRDRRDQELAIQAVRRQREIWQQMVKFGIADPVEKFPGANVTTDAQILDFLKRNAAPVWHASCTNKMGTQYDPMAVVDSKARVFGVKNLRVVDASAFPFLVPGHPQSTIYAFAEKIADDIVHGR